MKRLFDISQEEKNRILEMHSAKKNVISEQPIPTKFPNPKPTSNPNAKIPSRNTTQTTSNPNRRSSIAPKPSGAVSIPTPKKVVEGMTINLYDNLEESGQPQLSDKIVTIKRGYNQDVSLIMSETTVSINFKCGDNWVTMNEIDKLSNENPRLYNKQLINSLRNQFCQSNKQGTTVPKADFAMNNQQTDPTTGVA
jgi:hypothetical protein